MEESRKRHSGSKVSKIANIFQGMPSREEEEMRGADVTVVRTESHLARFNNARALFEKLGEENKGFRIEKSPSAAASFAGTRGMPPVAPSRSRSSSAGSVSPPRRIVTPTRMPPPSVNGDRFANGAGQPPPKPMKPSVLPKPEKPDRRFNKELIEKQRNWTAHFNKSRQARNDNETRVESHKIYSSTYQDRKSPEVTERYVVPSRVYSPPLSPCAGDSQAERPNTLPTPLISRSMSGTKSPSPIKSASVTPSPRPKSSPLTRSEPMISPSARKDVSLPKTIGTDTEQSDSNDTFRMHRSSVYPMSERESLEEIDNVAPKLNDRLQSPNVASKPIERISPIPPSPSNSAIIETFHPPISSKTPSPTTRSPRLPIIPNEENDEIPNERQREISEPLLPEDTPSASETVSVEIVEIAEITSIEEPESLPAQDEFKNYIVEEEEQEVRQNHQYENVSNVEVLEVTSLENDVYEQVQFSDEWDDKANRRSSTPESPARAAKVEEMLRSPLASPLASPVHRNPSSSSPPSHHASPSPGMYPFILNRHTSNSINANIYFTET
ncbi:Neurabin-1 [Operophtera brumata]|uniref:Neurabin-1 n=1 Tax=Operophtera brumata TaxID=104452 RepID=A0A0L7LKM5_OPEBR|nr:Neurabin-1 [Operophtera brumata]